MLSEASVETLHAMMEDVWTSQEGKVCSVVSWERFTSLQQAQVFTITLLGRSASTLHELDANVIWPRSSILR